MHTGRSMTPSASAIAPAAAIASHGEAGRGLDRAGDRLRAPLRAGATGAERVAELVRFATLAANAHNTQAWLFSAREDHVKIRPDRARRTPVVDPDDHHLFVSLGCAAENLAIGATAYGLDADVTFDPAEGGQVDIAIRTAGVAPSSLVGAIPRRQSNRSAYDGSVLTEAERAALLAAGQGKGVGMLLIEDARGKRFLRDSVVAGNTNQMSDSAFVEELVHWIRFSKAEALARGDGLYSACTGNPSIPRWIGRIIFPLVFRTRSENAKLVAGIDGSAALVLLVSARDVPANWVETGRVLERLLLTATQLGLACAFVNQAVEDATQRGFVASEFGARDQRPSILLRIGRAAPMPYSLRRDLAEVLV